MCMGQEHIGQGWHSGATVGVFSAAAGAARGLKLSAEQTVHALGIAGTQSAGPDGGAIRRHGQAHARRPLVAERALRRAARQERLHRHRRRVRGALRRLLHHVLALAGPLQARRAERGPRRAFRDACASRSSSIPASAATTPRSTPSATSRRAIRSRSTSSSKIVVHGSQVTVDHVGWPYRPEGLTSAQLNLPFCVATLLLEGDVLRRPVQAGGGRRSRAHRAVAQGRGRPRSRHHRARLEVPPQGARRRSSPRRLRSRARRARRRAAASSRSRPRARSSRNSASSRATP